MLFNSIDFAVFLPIVFALYWFVTHKNLKLQNALIVAASYLFYGWWDWRFLSLVFISTVIDYTVAIGLGNEQRENRRKWWLTASLVANLGMLGYFKYANFFITNFVDAFLFFGHQIDIRPLQIVLPVGISFYTFQTLSYTIDVYRGTFKPTKDFVAFSAYVTFFPQLVAGPIERAEHLLPQFFKKRVFDEKLAADGMRQILWGLFKKIVIADNCAEIVNTIYNQSDSASGSELLLASVFFAFQIYGDFSGYSDIAIGTARLFGFSLMQNFAFPYFSRDMAEFWRRWHISLSTWFRDYLYIPLGGSRGSLAFKIRNTMIIFMVSGFWHGANWTFITWGALNALYFLPLLITGRNRHNLHIVAQDRFLPTVKETSQILVTFGLTVFAWIFFRATSMTQAFGVISGIFSPSLFSIPKPLPLKEIAIVLVFLCFEWIGRRGHFALESLLKQNHIVLRWGFYLFIILGIYFLGNFDGAIEFIYFQF